jgi:pimeloyl-ACP methyl ester carboxylesterase
MIRHAPLETSADQRQRYHNVSPQPERFEDMMLQRRKCYATEPCISQRQLAGIARPVMVIAGGKDQYVSGEGFKRLAESIPGSSYVEFPDMSHDIRPFVDRIAAAVSDFNDQLP